MILHYTLVVLLSAAGLAAVGAFNLWLSRINQFFFFSRTVPDAFRQTTEAREIEMHYRRGVRLALAVSFLLLFSLFYLVHAPVLVAFTLALLALCLIANVGYAHCYRIAGEQIALWQQSQAVSPEAAIAAPQPIAVPLLAPKPGLGTLLSLVIAALVAAASWPIAMVVARMNLDQFSQAMEVAKADFLNGLGMGLLLGSFALYIQLRFFSRSRSSLAQFTSNTCNWLGWLGAAFFAASVLTVPMHWVISRPVHTAILGVVFAVALLRLLYGWLSARRFTPPMVEVNGDHFWRWGIFYCNSADPVLFIQSRYGPGYTLNFGNVFSWPIALFILADFVFLFVLNLQRFSWQIFK